MSDTYKDKQTSFPEIEVEFESSEDAESSNRGIAYFDETDGLHKVNYDEDNEYVWNPNTKEWELVKENGNVEQAKAFLNGEFAEANEAASAQIDKTPSVITHDYNSNGVVHTQQTWFKCTHKPTKLIETQDFVIYVGKKWDVEAYTRQFDLVLNLSGTTVREKHKIPIESLKKWENYSDINEMCLDWADMGVVSLPYKFWKEFVDYLKKEKTRLLVFCLGGHGRTGTAVASIMVAMGWSAKGAIDYIRNYYCDQAIENLDQEDYIYDIEKERDKSLKRKKKSIKTTEQGALPILVQQERVTEKPITVLKTVMDTSNAPIVPVRRTCAVCETTVDNGHCECTRKRFVQGYFTQDGKFYCTNICSNQMGVPFSFIPKGTKCAKCGEEIPDKFLKSNVVGEGQ